MLVAKGQREDGVAGSVVMVTVYVEFRRSINPLVMYMCEIH